MRWRATFVLLPVVLVAGGYAALLESERSRVEAEPTFQKLHRLVDGVRDRSYPRLKDAEVTMRDLRSDSVFFETRFTFSSYFFARKLRYMMMFNPEAMSLHVPEDGLRAIVAHELAHIDYFQGESRISLLGLVRLLSPSFTSRFERKADLEAIVLGYGPGLQQYRAWVYRNIPPNRVAEKKRDYFSPEEIEAILQAEKQNPDIMRTFGRCIPRDLAEIERETRNPAAACHD